LTQDDVKNLDMAVAISYRAEMAKLKLQLVLYRDTLLANGIEPPDRDGEELLELWRQSARVITAASDFVHNLGSGKEMMFGWKPASHSTSTA